MASGNVGRYRDRLLIEIIAETLGFDALAERLPFDVYPPYLFVVTGLFVEYGIIDLYNFFVSGKSSFLTQPNSLAIPVMTIIGVVGLRYIHDSYADAVNRLGVDDDADVDEDARTAFEGLVSLRTRVAVYLAVLAMFYGVAVFVLTIPLLIEIGGIGLVLYAQLVTFPLIVVPVLVELGVSYLAVHLALPRRIARADPGLFFYDPRNLGGFEPIGQLLKRSYYIFTAILLLWFLQSHAPVILSQYLTSPYPPPGPIVQVAISGVWLLGVLTIAYSMFSLHSLMKSKKEAKIQELEAEIKAAVKNPYDVQLFDVEDRETYEEAQESLDHVRQTKTYPTTVAMWSQILISVLLPQALNMVVQLPG